MFYCIDFDTRQVESKSESREPLDKYVSENDLEMAVAIVDSEDELCLQFSIEEMKDLASNIGFSALTSMDEEKLIQGIWAALTQHSNKFPDFTPKLGKNLLSGSKAKEKSESTVKPTVKKSAPKQSSGGKRISLNLEDPIFIVDGKCKSGSILATIVTAVEDELCGTFGEVKEYILENHIIPKTGELADEKFAEHNLKYFLKQGKISTEEEL